MTSSTISELLNKQINNELYSAYLYWDIAKHFECSNLKGIAHWYKLQAKEEILHAAKFFDYMIDQGCMVKFTDIAGPGEKLEECFKVAETSSESCGSLNEKTEEGIMHEKNCKSAAEHLAAARLALVHEKEITQNIYTIFKEAMEEGDFRTMKFLGWFIEEQTEEEKNAREIKEKFKLIGSCTAALLEFDECMGKRQ